MTLGIPWALMGLALLPLFWLWGGSSLVTAPVGRKRVSLAMRVVIFVLLVVALSDPRWQRGRQKSR